MQRTRNVSKSRSLLNKAERWSRRNFLKLSLAQLAVLGGGAIAYKYRDQISAKVQSKLGGMAGHEHRGTTPTMAGNISPTAALREFDYGTVTQENGRTVREFKVEAQSVKIPLGNGLVLDSWTFNGRIPGPTFRATEGDRVRVIFTNKTNNEHSMHFHGLHRAEADGVEKIYAGKTTVYEFDAEPFGVQLYHCHVGNVARHISRGLYGMFIIDPPGGRPPADEVVLIMAGYDLQRQNQNQIYAFNGIPDYYMKHPIVVKQNRLVRMYVLNMIEYDASVAFHLHANMFDVYRTGRTLEPSEETDVITMGTAERHMLECIFPYTGEYMFHPHQDVIAQKGCMGAFQVIS